MESWSATNSASPALRVVRSRATLTVKSLSRLEESSREQVVDQLRSVRGVLNAHVSSSAGDEVTVEYGRPVNEDGLLLLSECMRRLKRYRPSLVALAEDSDETSCDAVLELRIVLSGVVSESRLLTLSSSVMAISGVHSVHSSLAAEGKVSVTFDRERVTCDVIKRQIQELGFEYAEEQIAASEEVRLAREGAGDREELAEITLNIEGMTCASCTSSVEDVLREIDGVKSVTAGLLPGRAIVLYDKIRLADVSVLSSAVESRGFEVLRSFDASVADTFQTVVIPVVGMTCLSCTSSVTEALESIAGVAKVDVQLDSGVATVVFASSKVNETSLHQAIEDRGFDVAGQAGMKECTSTCSLHVCSVCNDIISVRVRVRVRVRVHDKEYSIVNNSNTCLSTLQSKEGPSRSAMLKIDYHSHACKTRFCSRLGTVTRGLC